MKEKLKQLEKELNTAHKEYLKVKDNHKSKEYKEARNKYLDLAEKYRKLFYKYASKENTYE